MMMFVDDIYQFSHGVMSISIFTSDLYNAEKLGLVFASSAAVSDFFF